MFPSFSSPDERVLSTFYEIGVSAMKQGPKQYVFKRSEWRWLSDTQDVLFWTIGLGLLAIATAVYSLVVGEPLPQKIEASQVLLATVPLTLGLMWMNHTVKSRIKMLDDEWFDNHNTGDRQRREAAEAEAARKAIEDSERHANQ